MAYEKFLKLFEKALQESREGKRVYIDMHGLKVHGHDRIYVSEDISEGYDDDIIFYDIESVARDRISTRDDTCKSFNEKFCDLIDTFTIENKE